MLLGDVVPAVGPDHGVQKARILRQCIGMVVTATMSSQGARVLRKCREETVLHSRRSASTRDVVAAAANEYMSSAKGNEVDELVVVEIKKLV